LRPLLEDRGHITESIHVLVPVNGMNQKCSTLAVQQQKRLCRQFVDVSVARRGCHTMKHAVFYHIVFSVSYRIRGHCYCCYMSFQCMMYDSDYIAVVLQLFIVRDVNRCLFCTLLYRLTD